MCDQAVMMLKIVNMLYCEGLQNKFIERSSLSKYNTRNTKSLHIQKLKLEHTKRSFCIQLQALGIVPCSPLEMPRPLHNLHKVLKSHLLS